MTFFAAPAGLKLSVIRGKPQRVGVALYQQFHKAYQQKW